MAVRGSDEARGGKACSDQIARGVGDYEQATCAT